MSWGIFDKVFFFLLGMRDSLFPFLKIEKKMISVEKIFHSYFKTFFFSYNKFSFSLIYVSGPIIRGQQNNMDEEIDTTTWRAKGL